MKTAAKILNPEDYILSVLSPEDRLDAAFKIAREAFKETKLTLRDINNAVKLVRRKAYGKKRQGNN
jgi:GH35 family endo-1,4-beta-xylanase